MQNYLPACKLVATHGVRGELRALLLCDDVPFLAKFKTLYFDAEGAKSVPLQGARPQGNVALLKLGGVEDMDAARTLVGKTLYFARAELKLPKGRYLIDDVIGCAVRDADTGREYGEVTAVTHPGAQDIYTVRDAAGNEHMMPAVAAFVKSIDIAARQVLVTPIPGLLDDGAQGEG